MNVGYVYDPIFLEHDTGDHPERAKRLLAIMQRLDDAGLLEKMKAIKAEKASFEDLTRIHSPSLIEQIREMAESGGQAFDPDTFVSRGSYQAALYAAGGTIAAMREVLHGLDGAYALVRPPGHHATRTRAMGFCLFNNLAIAAAWALANKYVSRIAIVDFDVHHGNGTEQAFEQNPDVLYVSLHQHPLFPGTGDWRSTGSKDGLNTCVNIPLPAQTGDAGYRQAFQRLVIPAVRRFEPDIILSSAGYDAHWADPLGWMLLSLSGYRYMADALAQLARELCDGRIVYTLEGGYDLSVLSHGVATTIAAILDVPYEDVIGPAEQRETPVESILSPIANWHRLKRSTMG
ncbi:MAG: histone deacetylase [Anaerolineales bacterium]